MIHRPSRSNEQIFYGKQESLLAPKEHKVPFQAKNNALRRTPLDIARMVRAHVPHRAHVSNVFLSFYIFENTPLGANRKFRAGCSWRGKLQLPYHRAYLLIGSAGQRDSAHEVQFAIPKKLSFANRRTYR